MEPLHPNLRLALKRAHSGLTDEDIDCCEELLAARMQCDPEKDAERIEQLDRERVALIQRCMPRYAQITQAFAARAARPKRRPPPKVKIKRPRLAP